MAIRQVFSLTNKSGDEPEGMTAEQQEILRKVAEKVVRWKMTVPAILFLESIKPLNYIGSQMLVFFEPFVQTVFSWKDYDQFRIMMEQRESVERLLLKIEELDAVELEKEKEAKKKLKEKRKNLSWGKKIWSYIRGS